MQKRINFPEEFPVCWIYISANMVLGGGDQILLAHARALRGTRHRILLFSLEPIDDWSLSGALEEMGAEIWRPSDADFLQARAMALIKFPFLIGRAIFNVLKSRTKLWFGRFGINVKTAAEPGESSSQNNRQQVVSAFQEFRDPKSSHLYQRMVSGVLRRQLQRTDLAGVHIFHAKACSDIGQWAAQSTAPFLYTEILTPHSYAGRFPHLGSILQQCQEIIVPANAIAAHLKENYHLSNKFRIIPFTVPIQVTSPVSEFQSSRHNIGVLARLSEEKGHRFLLEAAPELLRRHPQIQLLFAGDGPLRIALQQRVAELGLVDKVRFLGRYLPEQLSEIMAQMDVVVLPSLTEGMPHVLVEAMAFGKPIVATDVGAVAEMVEQGVNGFVVGSGAVDELIEKIDLILSDAALRERLGQQGQRLYQQRYQYDLVLKKILDLCDDWVTKTEDR